MYESETLLRVVVYIFVVTRNTPILFLFFRRGLVRLIDRDRGSVPPNRQNRYDSRNDDDNFPRPPPSFGVSSSNVAVAEVRCERATR